LAIGPVFSSAFVGFLIAGAAGGAATLSTLIGAIGVLAVGWVITLYARRYAGAGAIYEYLRHSTPALGLSAAGIYFLGCLVLDTTGFLIIGFLATQFFQQYFHISLPLWVYAGVAALIVSALNYWGIRLTVRIQLTLTALSLIPLLALALVIIFSGGAAGNTLQVLNPTSVPLSGLFGGVLFAILLFVGFESSASLGEETANPRRSIPRAVVGTVIISAVFYLVIIYATTLVLASPT